MNDFDHHLLGHLAFAVRRDAEKGGAGLRSTREIADRESIPLARARRQLGALADAELVEAVEGGEWRITELGLASIEGPDQVLHSPAP